jgi:hypothetical protein
LTGPYYFSHLIAGIKDIHHHAHSEQRTLNEQFEKKKEKKVKATFFFKLCIFSKKKKNLLSFNDYN